MTTTDQRIQELFERLVPPTGKAPTEAGEIVRAITRIAYRNWNDGDHIGVGYGRETCNAPARYLQAHVGGRAREIIDDMWGISSETLYDAALELLQRAIIDYLALNPELEEKPSTEDMWDYTIESEDQDYNDEEDDW